MSLSPARWPRTPRQQAEPVAEDVKESPHWHSNARLTSTVLLRQSEDSQGLWVWWRHCDHGDTV